QEAKPLSGANSMFSSFGIAMNTLRVLACLAAFAFLSACDKEAPESSSSTSSSDTSVTPVPSQTMPETRPGTGPGEGGTAIGGVVGNQEAGGASTDDAPAATAGDGNDTESTK